MERAEADPSTLSTGERLLLDEARAEQPHPAQVTIFDDANGALTAAAVAEFAVPVRVHCDLLSAEQRIRQLIVEAADPPPLVVAGPADAVSADTDLVLLELPKSLAALEETAELIARHASPDVRLLGFGRVRHMTHGMNDVLARSFGSVRASRGRGKYRALVASDPRPDRGTNPTFPRRAQDRDLDLIVCAHGAAFAGTKVDRGTRLLLSRRSNWPSARTIVDLGCGTGILAAMAARREPGATVWAVDESAAACASAQATAAINDLDGQIRVQRADGLSGLADASVDLILCNPPFHVGTAKDSAPALAMFDDVARVLRRDGELWTVFNTHLPYRQALRAAVGPTTIVAQDASYLVTRSRRADRST